MISKFELIFSTLLTIAFSLGLLVFLTKGMWITFVCFSIASALTIKYWLFKGGMKWK